MCGETFSSKFSPDQKAAAAKAHPLARPGRWSVVYTRDQSTKDDPRRFHEHETAYFDYEGAADAIVKSGGSRKGFATRREAEAALEHFQPSNDGSWFVLPPLEESGDHRIRAALASGAVSTDDLADFVDAVLNNRQAQFEPLRERFAAASLVEPPTPPAPKLTRAEAASALVAALVSEGKNLAEAWGAWRSGPGNAVGSEDFSDEDDEQEGDVVYDEDGYDTGDRVYYSFDPDLSRAIHAAVKAYVEAEWAEEAEEDPHQAAKLALAEAVLAVGLVEEPDFGAIDERDSRRIRQALAKYAKAAG